MKALLTIVSVALGGLVANDLNKEYKKYKGTYVPRAHTVTVYKRVPTGYKGWIKAKYKMVPEKTTYYY